MRRGVEPMRAIGSMQLGSSIRAQLLSSMLLFSLSVCSSSSMASDVAGGYYRLRVLDCTMPIPNSFVVHAGRGEREGGLWFFQYQGNSTIFVLGHVPEPLEGAQILEKRTRHGLTLIRYQVPSEKHGYIGGPLVDFALIHDGEVAVQLFGEVVSEANYMMEACLRTKKESEAVDPPQ